MNRSGGKNTTFNGIKFEQITDLENIMKENGYVKMLFNNRKNYYLKKDNMFYMKQHNFKKFVEIKFGKKIYRVPDEAFIIMSKDKIFIKIIEKKFQKQSGSVEDKIMIPLKREYELYFNDNKYHIDFCYCLCDYFKEKFSMEDGKFKVFKQILEENKVFIKYGNTVNYAKNMIKWLMKIEGK